MHVQHVLMLDIATVDGCQALDVPPRGGDT
jgi:hypothetical protein